MDFLTCIEPHLSKLSSLSAPGGTDFGMQGWGSEREWRKLYDFVLGKGETLWVIGHWHDSGAPASGLSSRLHW